jgi:hypothetical protein
MPAMEPRKYSVQREFERSLSLFSSNEAIEILARATASIMARDPSRFTKLAELFKQSLNVEYDYQIHHRHTPEGAA